ncbi:hypothetical protein [Streptomyces sp. NPDC004726]
MLAQTPQFTVPQEGRRTPASDQITYTYDSLGRLIGDRTTDAVDGSAGSSDVASLSYGYDLDDRLTTKNTTGTAGAAARTW